MKTTVCFSPNPDHPYATFIVAYTTTTSAIPDIHYAGSLAELPDHLKDAGRKAITQPHVPVDVTR